MRTKIRWVGSQGTISFRTFGVRKNQLDPSHPWDVIGTTQTLPPTELLISSHEHEETALKMAIALNEGGRWKIHGDIACDDSTP